MNLKKYVNFYKNLLGLLLFFIFLVEINVVFWPGLDGGGPLHWFRAICIFFFLRQGLLLNLGLMDSNLVRLAGQRVPRTCLSLPMYFCSLGVLGIQVSAPILPRQTSFYQANLFRVLPRLLSPQLALNSLGCPGWASNSRQYSCLRTPSAGVVGTNQHIYLACGFKKLTAVHTSTRNLCL